MMTLRVPPSTWWSLVVDGGWWSTLKARELAFALGELLLNIRASGSKSFMNQFVRELALTRLDLCEQTLLASLLLKRSSSNSRLKARSTSCDRKKIWALRDPLKTLG